MHESCEECLAVAQPITPLGYAPFFNEQVKDMYRTHDEYESEDSWLRAMEDWEYRGDMLAVLENIMAEVCS